MLLGKYALLVLLAYDMKLRKARIAADTFFTRGIDFLLHHKPRHKRRRKCV